MEASFTSDVIIRPETAEDYDAIDELVITAFRGRSEMVPLVRAIRDSSNYVPEYSLVAEDKKRIIGHVMLSYVYLQDEDKEHRILSLSPLAVSPDMQQKGIGSRLVTDVLVRADANNEPLVLLEGSPHYYPRFGFEPAINHGISFILPSWAPPEAAMVKRLSSDDVIIKGHVIYPPAFDLVSD